MKWITVTFISLVIAFSFSGIALAAEGDALSAANGDEQTISPVEEPAPAATVPESVPEPAPSAEPAPAPEPAPEAVSEPAPASAPEVTPAPVPDPVSEPAPAPAPEPVDN